MQTKKNIGKNILLMIVVFAAALVISLTLESKFHVYENITAIFVFAVFLISMLTDGYLYGTLSAFAGVLAVNYAFTFPYFKVNFMITDNLISAAIMITIAILTGALTTKIKEHEMMKAEGERERMRANLLRAVSHDLRTPLTTIYGASATLLENREDLTEEQKVNILTSIQQDSDWLMRMVENLLSITKIDSGRIKIIKTPTVLDELIDSVINKFAKRYPGQEVQLELPDEIVVIPMDAILIEQVIVNILENAVLHAKGMTSLTLRVFTVGKKAVFEILDNGCGVSEERLRHMFTGGLESQENSADSKRRNAGIGLSVCATIVKAHGGQIEAENRKDGGAVFRFTLDKEEIRDE